MTGPEHYQMAESLTMTAAGLMDADTGIYARMGTEERLQRRRALTAEAQVHATLALAAATALTGPVEADWPAWRLVAGSKGGAS